jgi:tRNA(Arg) A34 adenosine deaminase TadA
MDIVIAVPDWIDLLVLERGSSFPSPTEKMRLAIALAARNVELGGGPFGAVVFEGDQVLAAGVNLVMTSNVTLAHAEIVALLRAQVASRGQKHGVERVLYTSAEPCCQCFGALVWSGLHGVVCAATTPDVEAIGFNEGPKPERWHELLEGLGFEVTLELERERSRQVLAAYSARGGSIYGPGRGALPVETRPRSPYSNEG